MKAIERNHPDQQQANSGLLPSELFCDWSCIVFALWTLNCHLVVALGGAFQHLLTLSALTMSVGLGFFVKWRRWIIPSPLIAPTESPGQSAQESGFALFQKGSASLGLAGLAIAYWFSSIVTVWWWMAGMLTIAAVVAVFSSPFPVFLAPHAGRAQEKGLWLIALACAVLTLICHRPNADDAFYINTAVASVDFPHQPILSLDTLHGIPNLPIHLPAYRVHSYELWNGALSYLTGIPAIYCFHWFSATLAALFVPLAYAHLFRVLTPKYWLWAVVTIVFLFIAVGETHRWYGNFAFVKMWHGKSIFLSVLLPLIYSYALRFAQQPTLPRWLLLATAQIAAVGYSSSALWTAPLAALMTLGSMFHPSRAGIRIFLTGSLASAYVLLLGWLIKGELSSLGIQSMTATQTASLDKALVTVLGDSCILLFGLASLLVAWACCPRGIAQRFAIGASLTALLVLLNPYASKWIAANVTGPSYWRSFWGVPLPILMTLVLITPLQLDQGARRRLGGRIVYLLVLAAFAVFAPKYSGLSPHNGVRMGLPELKTPLPEYRWAAKMNQSVSAGSYVVAPPDISTWIPTFSHHAYPLLVRNYLALLRSHFNPDDMQARVAMTRYTAGEQLTKNAATVFAEGLARFNIAGVCLQRSDEIEEARTILQEKGFHRTEQDEKYEIWIR